MVRELATKVDFDSAINGAGGKLVVVDFTATWCGPCQFITPEFENPASCQFFRIVTSKLQDKGQQKFEEEFAGRVVFVKVDVDKNTDTAEFCEIRCMPTFMFYKNGEKVSSMTGADVKKLRSMIEQLQ